MFCGNLLAGYVYPEEICNQLILPNSSTFISKGYLATAQIYIIYFCLIVDIQ